jgi:uncharacterized protein YidB (DUF937 family)
MGLLDSLLGGLGGQHADQFGNPSQQGSLMDMATGLISGQPGGLSGLLDQFRSAGLGQQADSWVSTGQNMPVTGDQMSSALGHGQMQNMSQKLGLPPGAVAGALAMVLPMIIDRLTPKGQVEPQHQAGNDLSSTLASLKSTFLGRA